jgi:hypothetical protein
MNFAHWHFFSVPQLHINSQSSKQALHQQLHVLNACKWSRIPVTRVLNGHIAILYDIIDI